MDLDKHKLFDDGIAPDENHPNLEKGKQKIFDELSFVEGIFNWFANITDMCGSFFKGAMDFFKTNK